MNRRELKKRLAEEGINTREYSLHGGLPELRYVIENIGCGWSVYYSERGERYEQQSFDTESEACEELLRRLLADPATRVDK